MNKIIVFYPNPDYKQCVGLKDDYDAKLYPICKHKGKKLIEYRYDTIVSLNGDTARRKNYSYTMQVCLNCFQKYHEHWIKGTHLRLKYPKKETLHFWKDSDIKSTSNLK